MKLSFFATIVLFLASLQAQEKIIYTTYSDIQEELNLNLQEKKYEACVALIDKINVNDSIYNTLSITKSYALLRDEKYAEAIEFIDDRLTKCDAETKFSLLLNKAVSYERNEKYAEAISVYDKLIEAYPKAYQPYYNKSLNLIKKEKWNESYDLLQKALMLRPFSRDTHYKIGELYYGENKLSQALMATSMSLFTNPNKADAIEYLKIVNTFFSRKNKDLPKDITYSKDDNSFKNLDLILVNGVALNADYKIKNKIKIALVKQLYVLFDQIESIDGKGDFWSQKMLPFFKWIKSTNNVDNFIYTICYSIENASYKKEIQKNEAKIIDFVGVAYEKWLEILSKDNLETFENEVQKVNYLYENREFLALGKANGELKVGNWYVYNDQGKFIRKGSFSDKGKKDGLWTSYDSEGNITQTINYKNGELDGTFTEFFKDGKVAYKYEYKLGKLEGDFYNYNENGMLKTHKVFANNLLNGTFQTYYNLGEQTLEKKIVYKDGELNGPYQVFYNTGEKYVDITYVDGKFTGEEVTYYRDGKVRSNTNYIDNMLNGSYQTFYKSGNKNVVGQFTNDYRSGVWEEYYDEGTIKEKYEYNGKGELQGSYNEYDIDGVLSSELIYKNGLIYSIKFFNKKGEVIYESKRKSGDLDYKVYSPYGTLICDGKYDVKGGKKGNWNYYTNGALNSVSNYEENNTTGEAKWYYIDGDLSGINQYKDDKKQGYSVSYYQNGQMEYQGYYENDLAVGEWRTYYQDGTLARIRYYHKDKLHGLEQNFSVDGKIYSEKKHHFGELKEVSYYHNDGKLLESIKYNTFPKQNKINYLHYNNTTHTSYNYVGGKKHGTCTKYHFNGELYAKGEYYLGEMHGEWKFYNDRGQLTKIENYSHGKLNGKVEYFDNNQLTEVAHYQEGNQVGKNLIYYQNSDILKKEFSYREDKYHGTAKFYTPKSELQYVRYYNDGELLGYSYKDKSGELLPMIPLNNQSGKIEAYFPNQKPSALLTVKNAKFVGAYKKFYENGQLQFLKNYDSKGVGQGKYEEYNENGQLLEKGEFACGERTGERKIYYSNGKLKNHYNYLNGSLQGKCFIYNKDGSLQEEKEYFNGSVIKEKKI